MKQRSLSQKLRCAAAVALGTALMAVWGCNGQNKAGSAPTQDQVQAFHGAPPSAQDRKDMAEAMRRQKPAQTAPGFSSVAPSPNKAAGK